MSRENEAPRRDLGGDSASPACARGQRAVPRVAYWVRAVRAQARVSQQGQINVVEGPPPPTKSRFRSLRHTSHIS